MNLNQKFVDFINNEKNPLWYRYVIRGVLNRNDFSETEIRNLITCILDKSYDFGNPLDAGEIPGGSGQKLDVHLIRVEEISNVNALSSSKPLTFGEKGLTLIYGDNGSGKSGYARVLRSAVGSVDKSKDDQVLGNVFSDISSAPSAKLVYKRGGIEGSWSFGDGVDRNLSHARFYDRECGNHYVTKDSEVSYQPFVISLLIRLADIANQMKNLATNEIKKTTEILPEVNGIPANTGASKFYDGLSATTDLSALDQDDLNFTDDLDEELHNLEEKRGALDASSPDKEKEQLLQRAEKYREIKDALQSIDYYTSSECAETLKNLKHRLDQAEKTASAAAKLEFTDEPLNGVGSETWKQLWEAAERFASVELEYEGGGIPHREGDFCVLCQQPLEDSGATRIARFHQFINDTSATNLKNLQGKIEEQRQKFSEILELVRECELLIEKNASLFSPEVKDALTCAISSYANAITKNINFCRGKGGNPAIFQGSKLLQDLQMQADEFQEKANDIDQESFLRQRDQFSTQIDDLVGRKQLFSFRKEIYERVDKLRKVEALEFIQKEADTSKITRFKTSLLDENIAKEIQAKYSELSVRLNVVRYAKMEKSKGRKDTGYRHRPQLVEAKCKADVVSVLSEGEQTALGLAGFLTEALYSPDSSTLIFDDPVTSMDAKRRVCVSNVLLSLAVDRQVIVFTHDIAFVADILRVSADHNGVEVHKRMIQRRGEKPGYATESFDWELKDSKARANELVQESEKLIKDFNDLPEDQFKERTSNIAGKLSMTWERAIAEYLAFPIISPGDMEIRPRMMKIYPKFSDEDLEEFESGYAFSSLYAQRHDNVPQKNVSLPEPKMIVEECERLLRWIDRVRRYKS